MDNIMSSTNNSNSLPLVKSNKCEGCHKNARDPDVLQCYLCKNRFHVVNCSIVTETLQRDALPSNTNLTNFIKFSANRYPTGTFIWTCFRCGVIKQLAGNEVWHIGQRVALLESLLLTLSPTFSALATSVENGNAHDIANLVSDIRSSNHAVPVVNASINAPASPEVVPHQAVVSCNTQFTTEPSPQIEFAESIMSCKNTPAACHADHGSRSKHDGARSKKIKIKVSSKDEAGPLRSRFHHAHSAGKIGSYSIRYHSNYRADLLFDSISDAEAAYKCLTDELEDIEVSYPTLTNTKMVHIVGLTKDDSKDSLYEAICKRGRNCAIEDLINPFTFRVLDIKPCNKNPHVYRASAVISEEIWDIILNKMNQKIKIDYLSCSVFLRPNSVRCYKCQRLGHSAQNCKGNITCVVCGGGHNSEECVNTPNCINCSELQLESNHRADSPHCTAYKNFRKGPAKK